MEKINKRQKAIFDFIKERINEKGIAPSVREIGEAVGLRSTSSVQYNLNVLEDAGYIIRDANMKRTGCGAWCQPHSACRHCYCRNADFSNGIDRGLHCCIRRQR